MTPTTPASASVQSEQAAELVRLNLSSLASDILHWRRKGNLPSDSLLPKVAQTLEADCSADDSYQQVEFLVGLACLERATLSQPAASQEAAKVTEAMAQAWADRNGINMRVKDLMLAIEDAQTIAATHPQQPSATGGDGFFMLDDEGKAMIVNSHHYTVADIRALIEQLKAFANPLKTTQTDFDNLDWRGFCNVLWRVMMGLACDLPPASQPTSGAAGDAMAALIEARTAMVSRREAIKAADARTGGITMHDAELEGYKRRIFELIDALSTPPAQQADKAAAQQGVLVDQAASLQGKTPTTYGPFVLGNWYQTQGGDWVKIVGVANKGRSYETVIDQYGHHRYTVEATGPAGRVTGSAHDFSNQGNIKFTTPQPSQQAATSGFVSVVPGSFVANPEMSTEAPGLTKGEAAQYLGQRKAFEASQQARQPMTDEQVGAKGGEA